MQYTAKNEMTALEALRLLYPDSSRRTLQSWIRVGRFTIGDSVVQRESDLLQPGQTLQTRTVPKRTKVGPLPILYEDRHCVVVDKPEGLLSVPLDDPTARSSALSIVRQYTEKNTLFSVHRIDRETSGVLLFAKTLEAKEAFSALWEAHDLERTYFAIVEGRLEKTRGSWEAPLLELPSFDVVSSPNGKKAISHFFVHRRSQKYSYLALRLDTGKKHQIRVHCQIAGHPIVGDLRYGATENPMGRMALHAAGLHLSHPLERKMLSIVAPLPKSFLVLGACDADCRNSIQLV